MRYGKSRGSFLPVLMNLVHRTTGPILELGMGFCSTPFLHWACFPNRKLVSFENNPEYYRFARSWRDGFHEVHCISDWDSIDISMPWSIAFVDHEPNKGESRRRRCIEVSKLLHADYVVIHDSENANDRKYGLNSIRHLFKYRYKYTKAHPYTSVWSNKFVRSIYEKDIHNNIGSE